MFPKPVRFFFGNKVALKKSQYFVQLNQPLAGRFSLIILFQTVMALK